ncbi:hypothetical protein EXIGLDRAFT_691262 [Exidia glandulosa HHB12029]|uniref:YTH domain-containing protein n=1 Tax=Exidia glandulosa HHB12029 TaxID=1314781 RepID=A0A166AP43_EXIGL|nr:hypothetical protein EXIGLDRAFT_691262 [Exidia glandulosa HHB12029]
MRVTAPALTQALQHIVAQAYRAEDASDDEIGQGSSTLPSVRTVDGARTPPPVGTPSSSGATRGTNNSDDSLSSHDLNDPLMPENRQPQPRQPKPAIPPPHAAHDSPEGSQPSSSQFQHGSASRRGPGPGPYPTPLTPSRPQHPSQTHSQHGGYMQQAPYMAYSQASYPGQYTMSPQPQPHFAYTHAYATPSILAHAPDPAPLSALGYRATASPLSPQHGGSMFPFMHPQQQLQSADNTPGPSSTPFQAAPPPPQTPPSTYHHQDAHPSTQAPASSPLVAHTPQSPFGQYGVHYPASPVGGSFYPPHSYSHSAPSIYQGQYTQASYGQPYVSQAQPDDKGTWWFVPAPRSSPAFDPNMHSQAAYTTSYPLGFQAVQPRRQDAEQSFGPVPPLSPFPTSPAMLSAGFPRSGPPSSDHTQSPIVRSPTGSHASRIGAGRGTPRSPASRMPYHPSVPPSRSEWVMWVGNVPSDASDDELRQFFNTMRLPQEDGSTGSEGEVTSVFLISRSNCAFVNFRTEAGLEHAVQYFNGQPLRPADPRCPRLVCRVRKKDDDLKAGVGGQRGMGMHTRWVRDQQMAAVVDPREGSEQRPGPITHPHEPSTSMASNSSGSYASTNSSFLLKHFPSRYFIMKSLSEQQLLKSVEAKVWSTQQHNEGILDQAYRTSKDVFLIFSANKSGEFFGYARMAGRVQSSSRNDSVPAVGWHSRAESLGQSPTTSRGPHLPNLKEEDEGELALPKSRADQNSGTTESTLVESNASFPHRLLPDARVEASPSPLTPADGKDYTTAKSRVGTQSAPPRQVAHPHQSAPPVLGPPHNAISYEKVPKGADTLDDGPLQRNQTTPAEPVQNPSKFATPRPFDLDPKAAINAVRERDSVNVGVSATEPALVLSPPVDDAQAPSAVAGADDPDWGTPFKIEWIRTERLPFHRTRHLRNPWNHDREVKVSRDGTELEPTVGARLLEEWDRPEGSSQPPPPPPLPTTGRRGRGGRGGGGGGPRAAPALNDHVAS